MPRLIVAEGRELRRGRDYAPVGILVIQAIRSWIATDPAGQSEPATPWTGASLAQETAMSWSAFAARLGYESKAAFSRAFKRPVGISPGAARRSPPDTRPQPPSRHGLTPPAGSAL